jgi:hypothetical protein
VLTVEDPSEYHLHREHCDLEWKKYFVEPVNKNHVITSLALLVQRYAQRTQEASLHQLNPDWTTGRRMRAYLWFKPYIDILPDPPNPLPYFYNESQLDALHGSSIADDARTKRQFLRGRYDPICEIASECMPGFCDVISFDDWLWAYSAVQSRSFLAPLPKLKKVGSKQSRRTESSTPSSEDRCGGGNRDTDSANVPLIDMANHGISIKGVKRGSNSAYRFDHETKSFKLFALEPVAAGQV